MSPHGRGLGIGNLSSNMSGFCKASGASTGYLNEQ